MNSTHSALWLPFLAFSLTSQGGLVPTLLLRPRNCVSPSETVSDSSSKNVTGSAVCHPAWEVAHISLAGFCDFKWFKSTAGTLVNYNMD